MAINRGTGSIRRGAKNYIHAQAQSRLDEVVHPYQQIGENALKVDSLVALFYHVTKSSTVCSCKQVHDLPTSNADLSPVLEKPKSIVDHTVRLDLHRPLFGFGEQQTAEDEVEEDEFAIDEKSSTPQMVDHILGSSSDCGICYKQGFVPGYSLLGYEHRLLGVHNIVDVYGYSLNRTCSPTRFELEDYNLGYAEFEIDVPLYFNTVKFSVRNNTVLLPEPVLYDVAGNVLTLAMLKAAAGGTFKIRIKDQAFTHAVIDFDIGSEPIRTNLSQGNKTLDWTMFDTFGTVQAILPVTIPEVSVGDVIVIPSRGQSFKVTDITFLRTAKDYTLDWSVNVRILQPQEYLKYISSGSTL